MSVVDGGGVRVLDVAFDHPLVRPLIAEQQAELAVRYGGEADAAPVDAEQFFPPTGSFFVAVLDGEPVGCAGLRAVPEEDAVGRTPAAEIKRMYTRDAVRRKGVAATMLRVLSFRAIAMRRSWLLLETGTKQPEAVAMYERFGFERVSGFGYYKDYPDQICMAFDLTQVIPERR